MFGTKATTVAFFKGKIEHGQALYQAPRLSRRLGQLAYPPPASLLLYIALPKVDADNPHLAKTTLILSDIIDSCNRIIT